VIDLPIGRQTFDFDCGAKALQIVMAYYGLDIREDELMQKLECTTNGASVKRIISVAEEYGFHVEARNGCPLETVKQYVDSKHPVILLLQAWAERYMTLEDWRQDNDDGHYVIVVGYQGNIFIFEDPASFRRTWLTEEELISRWHDLDPTTGEKYERFAMVLLGREPTQKKLEHMG
jgi:ABC-type bacteriocin/lantibiotic exporter with double-glycine peptidase domain